MVNNNNNNNNNDNNNQIVISHVSLKVNWFISIKMKTNKSLRRVLINTQTKLKWGQTTGLNIHI